MSVEFRKREIGEYLQMVRRRKWHILLPTLTVTLAVAWAVWSAPSVYQSTALLAIKAPTISEKVAPSLTDNDLSQRIQTISQNILSRSSLEPMVTRHNLFESERAAGVPMEEILVRMRNNINVEFEKVDEEKVIGFRITYRDRTPEHAQAVTAELSNKYIAVPAIESDQSAKTTKEFIDNQLNTAKASLDALEKQRLEIMSQNVETLPESSQGLIAQLEGLMKREETISKDKDSLLSERGRIQESIRSLNSQMRLLQDFNEKETGEAVAQASRVEDTPAYAQLVQRRAELSARLENLRKQYRDKHPEIIQAETDIAKINDELDKLSKNTDRRVKQATQSQSRKAELQTRSLGIEKDKAESQIAQIDQQLQAKENEMRQNSGEINALEAKINTIPNVKVQLAGIDNQYQSAKGIYDELLKKYNTAQGNVDREENYQGETIRMVDSANLPQVPVNATKKPVFTIMGGAIGLAIGLFLAGFYEFPRFFTIQNVDDVKHYTGLPVLATIPPLLTNTEVANANRIYLLKLSAGVAASILSVPILIIIFQMSRLFERIS